jgi:hypothetical protein
VGGEEGRRSSSTATSNSTSFSNRRFSTESSDMSKIFDVVSPPESETEKVVKSAGEVG